MHDILSIAVTGTLDLFNCLGLISQHDLDNLREGNYNLPELKSQHLESGFFYKSVEIRWEKWGYEEPQLLDGLIHSSLETYPLPMGQKF